MRTLLSLYLLQTLLGFVYWNHKLTLGHKLSLFISLCILPNMLLVVAVLSAKLKNN